MYSSLVSVKFLHESVLASFLRSYKSLFFPIISSKRLLNKIWEVEKLLKIDFSIIEV